MVSFTVHKRITVDGAMTHPFFAPVVDLLQDNTKEMQHGLVMNIVPKKRDIKQKKELCQKVISCDLFVLIPNRLWRRSIITLVNTALQQAFKLHLQEEAHF